ncbi:MAG: alpha/beta hydrolase [Marinomonas sp.]
MPVINSGGDVIDRRAIPAHAAESRWAAEDGHSIRRIDWPGASPKAPRGSILFFPGRGDNYEKYLETLEEWHREGWRVTASDWRGQAGSGRYGDDAVTGHISDFSVWIADLAQIWAAWVKETPGPHVLAAHSMGGHLVMRGLVEGVVTPDAMLLSAPMLRMSGPKLPQIIQHMGAKIMCLIGNDKRQAWKWSEKPGELPKRRRELLTHDDDRYEDEVWWRDNRPEIVMGPASWRWVERGYASVRIIEANGVMEAVDTPVLIISTNMDKLVVHSANALAAERLPKGELLELGAEARHEVFREVDAVRERIKDAARAFLDRVAPQKGDGVNP